MLFRSILYKCANSLLDGLYLSDPMQPIPYSRSVNDICEELVALCFDEDKQRRIITSSDFGDEVELGQGSDQSLKLLDGCVFVCVFYQPCF